MTPTTSASFPLDGIKVLDFTTVMAGPYCTRVLASLGADVVKVESRDGDYTRGAAPMRDKSSAYFAELNNGKSGIVLDLKNPLARDAAEEMLLKADVVVENMRAGSMHRLGLGYAAMSAKRPDLVYCSITGFGQEGPYSTRPATAQIVHATAGYDLAFAGYQQGDVDPPATGLFIADGMAGALAVAGILAALRVRDATGIGRQVDVALDQALLSALCYEVQTAQFKQDFVRKGYRPVRTRDGFVMIAAVNKRNFESLSRVIGRPDLLTDLRFATTAPRWRAYDELHAIIEQWSLTLTSEACEQALLEHGVPVAQYRTVASYLDDPRTRSRLLTAATDDSGPLTVSGAPFHLVVPDALTASAAVSRSGEERPRRVPALGGDTRVVLEEWLGPERAELLLAAGAAVDSSQGWTS